MYTEEDFFFYIAPISTNLHYKLPVLPQLMSDGPTKLTKTAQKSNKVWIWNKQRIFKAKFHISEKLDGVGPVDNRPSTD